MDAIDRKAHSKLKGKIMARIKGLTISAELMMPKRKGKIRVLIQIRQHEGHDWHVSECLSYTRGVDIIFATDTARDSDGLVA